MKPPALLARSSAGPTISWRYPGRPTRDQRERGVHGAHTLNEIGKRRPNAPIGDRFAAAAAGGSMIASPASFFFAVISLGNAPGQMVFTRIFMLHDQSAAHDQTAVRRLRPTVPDDLRASTRGARLSRLAQPAGDVLEGQGLTSRLRRQPASARFLTLETPYVNVETGLKHVSESYHDDDDRAPR